jgi:SAM-dependent methyltransferase
LNPQDSEFAASERQSWERVIEPLLSAPAEGLWRIHSDAVNVALLARWLPEGVCQRLLKTDLFDEAMGDGLYPLLATRARNVAALDFARPVLAAAAARYPNLLAAVGDVRRLPFAGGTFDVVVSNSTLDHFQTRKEILTVLRELHRVLCRDGWLLLTMDNPVNPLVAARNVLPFRLLHRLGLVPYPTGATCGPLRLGRILRAEGFEVYETVALLHCPRALAVAKARRLQQQGTAESRARFLRRLLRWEWLARLPTRYLTGYFVGVSARKV